MPKPKLKIDPQQVVDLAKLGCSVREIADFLHCSDTTINNRFMPQLIEGRAEMKISLRRAQLQSALAGNNTMLVWLGKQILGQADTQNLNVSTEVKATEDDKAVLEGLLEKLGK